MVCFCGVGLFSLLLGVVGNDVLIHLYYLGCCNPLLRSDGSGVFVLDLIEKLLFYSSINLRFVSSISALIPPLCTAFTLFIFKFNVYFRTLFGATGNFSGDSSEYISDDFLYP